MREETNGRFFSNLSIGGWGRELEASLRAEIVRRARQIARDITFSVDVSGDGARAHWSPVESWSPEPVREEPMKKLFHPAGRFEMRDGRRFDYIFRDGDEVPEFGNLVEIPGVCFQGRRQRPEGMRIPLNYFDAFPD